MFAFVAVAPALAVHTSPGTIFVDDDNPCTGDGTSGDPFCNIQLAVDHANAGDTIKVDDGTYGGVTIPSGKNGLTLEAASSPIIDCMGTGVGSVGNGITIGSDGVTIDGFEIRKCDNGIASAGGISDAIIKNNDIHDNLNPSSGFQGVGILLGGSGDNDRNTITKNTIHDNDRQGIFLGGSCFSPATSTDNVISKNKIFGNGADVTTTKSPDASQYGIQLCNADRNLISKNEISDHNTWSRGVGIYLWNSDHNIVVDNELEENRVGIRISGGSHHNLIHDNEVEKGLSPATLVGDGRATAVADCPFAATLPATGIWVLDEPCDSFLAPEFFPTPDNVIANNEVEKNAGWGIDVNVDTIVADNEVEKNGLGGLVVRGSGNNLSDNKAEKNSGDGFRAMPVLPSVPAGVVGPSFDNFFVNNKSDKNTGFGFNDLTTGGTGTGGTDNAYLNNKCKNNTLGGSSPPNVGLLCSPQL